MDHVFENKKIKLSAKTPIHIGSYEGKLTPFNYIKDKNFVYPVSDEKLANFLQKRKLTNQFLEAVSKKHQEINISTFFSENRIKLSEDDLLFLSNGRKIRVLGDSFHEFRPIIRDGFSRAYIPGTSIKGAIRTAILYNALLEFRVKDEKGFLSEIIERIERIIKGMERRDGKQFRMRGAFQDIQNRWLIMDESSSSNTDWLRMLHVTDAYPLNLKETVLIPVKIIKKERNGWMPRIDSSGKQATMWVEVFPQGTIFEFELSWDLRLLSEFKLHNSKLNLPQDLESVLRNLKIWSSQILNFERDFTKGGPLWEWYKANSANFRVGFGSGMLSTTIALLLPEKTRKSIRNLFGQDRGDEDAPKSRRVWFKNEREAYPLGWAQLEVVK